MPPTTPPSTTRGIRIFQTIAHSLSLTPVSIEISGRRLTNSSGTRHQSGPAGPDRGAEDDRCGDARRTYPEPPPIGPISHVRRLPRSALGGDADLNVRHGSGNVFEIVHDARTPA